MVTLMAYRDVLILLNIATVMKWVQLWNHCHAKAVISALVYISNGLILKLMSMMLFLLPFAGCLPGMIQIG